MGGLSGCRLPPAFSPCKFGGGCVNIIITSLFSTDGLLCGPLHGPIQRRPVVSHWLHWIQYYPRHWVDSSHWMHTLDSVTLDAHPHWMHILDSQWHRMHISIRGIHWIHSDIGCTSPLDAHPHTHWHPPPYAIPHWPQSMPSLLQQTATNFISFLPSVSPDLEAHHSGHKPLYSCGQWRVYERGLPSTSPRSPGVPGRGAVRGCPNVAIISTPPTTQPLKQRSFLHHFNRLRVLIRTLPLCLTCTNTAGVTRHWRTDQTLAK